MLCDLKNCLAIFYFKVFHLSTSFHSNHFLSEHCLGPCVAMLVEKCYQTNFIQLPGASDFTHTNHQFMLPFLYIMLLNRTNISLISYNNEYINLRCIDHHLHQADQESK